jgi:hypothetical protein
VPLVDLLQLREQRPPLGGMGFETRAGTVRAHWTDPLPGEPETRPRIIHAAALAVHEPVELHRLGVGGAQGYHKCGSADQGDWVRDVRVLGWADGTWQELLHVRDLPEPTAAQVHWLELGGTPVEGALIEIRRSGLDEGWTPWNLADAAFQLLGTPPQGTPPRVERRLRQARIDPGPLGAGMEVRRLPGEVRYRTQHLEVGFALGRPGFSFLGIDDEGAGRTGRDLLFRRPGFDVQGPMLHQVGSVAAIAPALRCDIDGEVEVDGASVRYRLELPAAGQALDLRWTVHPDRLELEATRDGDHPIEAWESSVWRTTIDVSRAAAATLGEVEPRGRVGHLPLPVLLHAPGHGTLHITSDAAAPAWRSDADRPRGWVSGDLLLGEVAQPTGTTVLHGGAHRALMTWAVRTPGVRSAADAPAAVERALRRTVITGLTFRPDTATFSNNGVSIHCPMSMEMWAELVARTAGRLADVPARSMLRSSLERWLDGGPGYGSGTMRDGATLRPAEDEYVITGVGTLLGLGLFLRDEDDPAWVRAYRDRIAHHLALMAARDVDDDGLVESPHRRGVSGEHHWSTNWFDVVSFGWKDAFVNAMLHPALRLLATHLPRLGAADVAADVGAGGLAAWADRLRAVYAPTFLNPRTGWVGGWRCAEGELHDHAHLAVTGAAVTGGLLEPSAARGAMERLWAEYRRLEPPDARLGLPVCLWPIPEEDLTEVMAGYPFGFYQNGALTHSQSRHFVAALHAVGMQAEGDELLVALCDSLGDGTAFGPSQSGVDWRYWDGAQCGYEGLLTEQFGVLAVAIDRFGA